VVFYAVVSDEIEQVIEFFPSRSRRKRCSLVWSATNPTGATRCTSSRLTSPPAGPTRNRPAGLRKGGGRSTLPQRGDIQSRVACAAQLPTRHANSCYSFETDLKLTQSTIGSDEHAP
jgi:hypothetical protein